MKTAEEWITELEAAGWKKKMSTVWESPFGKLYRGPYHAWRVMKSMQQVRDDISGFKKHFSVDTREEAKGL